MLFSQVRLRLSGVHTGWSGALRFGFTSLDPSELVATDIPKYACPDLVTRPGYWAKALPERLALKDNVLSFWADRHGRVFYSINEGEPILFHCGLSIGCPLWAIIDIYGITQEVTLLGKHFNLFPLGENTPYFKGAKRETKPTHTQKGSEKNTFHIWLLTTPTQSIPFMDTIKYWVRGAFDQRWL